MSPGYFNIRSTFCQARVYSLVLSGACVKQSFEHLTNDDTLYTDVYRGSPVLVIDLKRSQD